MSNHWIPLTGPGGRLPTEADYPLVLGGTVQGIGEWIEVYKEKPDKALSGWSHFFPQNKVPEPPKPREKTQQAIDMEKVNDLLRGSADLIIFGLNCLTHGRSDGRAQLAREALGLFDYPRFNLVAIADHLEVGNMDLTAETVRKLHQLLTKAAEEKP